MPLILFQLVKNSGPVGTKRLWTETLQIGAKLCGFFLFAIFFNEAQLVGERLIVISVNRPINR